MQGNLRADANKPIMADFEASGTFARFAAAVTVWGTSPESRRDAAARLEEGRDIPILGPSLDPEILAETGFTTRQTSKKTLISQIHDVCEQVANHYELDTRTCDVHPELRRYDFSWANVLVDALRNILRRSYDTILQETPVTAAAIMVPDLELAIRELVGLRATQKWQLPQTASLGSQYD
jgi:hypothetical protein